VRLERYVKDMLIELHTLREIVDTLVLPAAYAYQGSLAASAAQAKAAGIKEVPQVERANEVGALAKQLKAKRELLHKVTEKAEGMHDELVACAALLTAEGADRMAEVRGACDALEGIVGDEYWPLPKYREMLFPV
jgi:glutamine synthetase